MDPPHTTPTAFEAPIHLRGYDLTLREHTLEVDLWWEATGPLHEAYTVFVHLVNAEGTIMAQHDHIAGADTYPTNHWSDGTQVRDRFFLNLPELPDESHKLLVGLYTPQQRLRLADGNDAVEISLKTILLNTNP
jgi:hypothetical protein